MKKLSFALALLLCGSVLIAGTEGDTHKNVLYGEDAGINLNNDSKYNVFIGYESGYTSGGAAQNFFGGYRSGYSNTSGSNNVFLGYLSGYSNTYGGGNIFIGSYSGYNNETGDNNILIGYQSGYNNETGDNNVFIGILSGQNNTSGKYNTFIGTYSGQGNTSGSQNVFIGEYSGRENTTGKRNTCIGVGSGDTKMGDDNVYIGYDSANASKNEGNTRNTFVGSRSGYKSDVNGSVFIGYNAGYYATRNNTLYIDNTDTNEPLIYGEFDTDFLKINGSLQTKNDLEVGGSLKIGSGIINNPLVVRGSIDTNDSITAVFNGYTTKQAYKVFAIGVNNTNEDAKSDAGFSISNYREDFTWVFRTWESNKGFAIAKYGNGANKEFLLYDSDPDDSTTAVLKLGNGAYCDGVWHNASSKTYKKDIKPLNENEALKAFMKLSPVTFKYKSHPNDLHVGFIAEDVPELVADPGRKSISTLDIVAVLTKVVQTQQKKLKEKEAEIKMMKEKMAQMQHQIDKLKKLETKLSKIEYMLNTLQNQNIPQRLVISY